MRFTYGVRKGLKSLDLIDRLSVPVFVITMLAEAAVLRRRPIKRPLDDLDHADEITLSGPQLPGDPLVPLGYERKDTTTSLLLLVGNVAFGQPLPGPGW